MGINLFDRGADGGFFRVGPWALEANTSLRHKHIGRMHKYRSAYVNKQLPKSCHRSLLLSEVSPQAIGWRVGYRNERAITTGLTGHRLRHTLEGHPGDTSAADGIRCSAQLLSIYRPGWQAKTAEMMSKMNSTAPMLIGSSRSITLLLWPSPRPIKSSALSCPSPRATGSRSRRAYCADAPGVACWSGTTQHPARSG